MIAQEARQAFLGSLAKLVPESLFGHPEALLSGQALEWQRAGIADQVVAHIQRWQEHWHLSDGWMFQMAVDTLEHRSRLPADDCRHSFIYNEQVDPNDGRGVISTIISGKVIHDPNFAFDIFAGELDAEFTYTDSGGPTEYDRDDWIGTFDPRTETKADAKKRIMKELEVRLDRVLEERLQDDLQRGGAVRTQTKRTGEVTHYEWLIRNQVLGEDIYDIAASGNADPKSVRDGVKDVSRRLAGAI